MFTQCSNKVAERRGQDPAKGTTNILNELLADEVWLTQVTFRFCAPSQWFWPNSFMNTCNFNRFSKMFGMRGQKWINLTGNIVYQYSIPEFMGRQQTTGIDFRWFTSKEQFDNIEQASDSMNVIFFMKIILSFMIIRRKQKTNYKYNCKLKWTRVLMPQLFCV